MSSAFGEIANVHNRIGGRSLSGQLPHVASVPSADVKPANGLSCSRSPAPPQPQPVPWSWPSKRTADQMRRPTVHRNEPLRPHTNRDIPAQGSPPWLRPPTFPRRRPAVGRCYAPPSLGESCPRSMRVRHGLQIDGSRHASSSILTG